MFEVYFVQAKKDVLDTCNLMMDQSFFLSQKVHYSELFGFCKKNFVFWEVIVSGSILKKKKSKSNTRTAYTRCSTRVTHSAIFLLTIHKHTHTQACGSQNPLKL